MIAIRSEFQISDFKKLSKIHNFRISLYQLLMLLNQKERKLSTIKVTT